MLKNTIETIKERITLSKIIEEKVKLRRIGNRLTGLCPFHKEKTPSFSVNDDGKFYYCFGCGKQGDIIDFISETENISFNEALEKLALIAGIEIKKEKKNHPVIDKINKILNDLSNWFIKNLNSEVGKHSRSYIESRLDKKSIEKFKIGYCPQNLSDFLKNEQLPMTLLRDAGIIDRNNKCYFANRIIFPIENKQGNIIAFGSRAFKDDVLPKYINSPETILFKKSEVLYGVNLAKDFCKEKLVVVEGYMDVISLHQYGYVNSVGTLGTSITQSHLEQLFKLSRELVFCFDGDNAGLNAAQKVIKIIIANFISQLKIKVKFAFLPTGKDPDELIKNNKQYFQLLLDQSLQISEAIFHLNTINSTFDTPEEYITLEQNLFSYIEVIDNLPIKNHFKDFFRKQIFLLKRKKINKIQNKDLKLALLDNNSKLSHVLINLIIKFPEILNNPEIEEYFSMINFEENNIKVLQCKIIDFLNKKSIISKESLLKFLEQNKDTDIICSKLLNNDEIYHINDQSQAVLLWKKIIKEVEVKNLKKEYEKLLKDSTFNQGQLDKAQHILSKIHSYQN
jgi:DNA primase